MELLLVIQKVLTIPSFWNWVKYWYKKIALMRMKLFRGKKFKNEINFQLLMDSITYVHEFDPSIGSLSEAQRVQALLFLSLQKMLYRQRGTLLRRLWLYRHSNLRNWLAQLMIGLNTLKRAVQVIQLMLK